MTRIEVTNKVTIYETDGVETTGKKEYMEVRSHWNKNQMVVLNLGDIEGATSLTVVGEQLIRAINNAMNS